MVEVIKKDNVNIVVIAVEDSDEQSLLKDIERFIKKKQQSADIWQIGKPVDDGFVKMNEWEASPFDDESDEQLNFFDKEGESPWKIG